MSLKLEEQVPSLELCKKLKSLSYPQEGLFYWQIETSDSEFLKRYKIERFKDILITDSEKRTSDRYWKGKKLKLSYEHFVAPTVAEMGEWLPNVSVELTVEAHKGDDAYWFDVWSEEKQIKIIGGEEIEANARAETLIWLVENGHLNYV